MIQSGEVLPSPCPLTGSLLVTLEIFHVVSLQVSCTRACTVTFTILWLGGQSEEGSALAETITGGVVSTTTIAVEHDTVLFPASVTITSMTLVPSGRTSVKES